MGIHVIYELFGVNNFFTYTFLPFCLTCVRPFEFLKTLRFLASTLPVLTTGLVAFGALPSGSVTSDFFGVNSFFTYTFLPSCFTNVRPFVSLKTRLPLAFTFSSSAVAGVGALGEKTFFTYTFL
ncbi:hypothetical protein AR158_C320R [Paramecium bursaria Chlorella virus AR158]|uniref:hypothetical protein n=1 Tax=Paramecium bursaria Chlorella virus AR158 TaxID=380598 RepID=UPI00015AA924|nr:hypothetical protein AR158_C320R [Paramecium bursaria Chlorella virus AR158]ABU43865.1 hypothetical protein AR158_C320R [Paramecium bursaria Chlorella virus AR158]